MNADEFKGKWKQVKGKVLAKWGKLTQNDLDVISGNLEQLAGILQERYGVNKEEAKKQINEFLAAVQYEIDNAPAS
jgi:uncharacterized protein YjbJ (UPF0337 family)